MTEESGVPITGDDVPDEIIRSIHIAADAHTVWGIISEPGWFINDGTYTDHEITTENGVTRVVDPTHGEFIIGTEELDPPHRAVFRWLGGVAGPLDDFPSNTIEFTIQHDGEGVLLTVRERGFAGIGDDAAERRRRFEDNTQGWVMELDVARKLAEAA